MHAIHDFHHFQHFPGKYIIASLDQTDNKFSNKSIHNKRIQWLAIQIAYIYIGKFIDNNKL
jgi:hypothetical protein